MDIATLSAMLASCAPLVHPVTAAAIVAVESSGNHHAIGVVGGRLERQPRGQREAVATALALKAAGWRFSVGLAQINDANFARLGLDSVTAFDPCSNLAAMQSVLLDCMRAEAQGSQAALRRALSCYYSGNPRTGFDHGYVQRVVHAARSPPEDATASVSAAAANLSTPPHSAPP